METDEDNNQRRQVERGGKMGKRKVLIEKGKKVKCLGYGKGTDGKQENEN